MTVSTVDYSLMAGAAYFSTRDTINRLPFPEGSGWSRLAGGFDHRQDDVSGFEGVAFVRGNKIVISFAGTYDKSLADKAADGALAAGILDPQLILAARYYADIKRAYPDANISFTGHSLGGGLAALMGVLFDKKAVTFDQAPFRAAATMTNAVALQSSLVFSGYALDTDLLTFYSIPTGLTRLIRGEQKVSTYAVSGEFLSIAPSDANRIGYSRDFIPHGAMNEDSMNALHSQALLIALKHSGALRQATYQLPFLVRDIFDKNLFARDTGPENTDQRDFLTHLIRREFGVPGAAGSDVDLLTKFAADMGKLGIFSATEDSLRRPLEQIAMTHYYKSVTGEGREFFKAVQGGLQFDLTRPIGDSEIAATDLVAQVKGYAALLSWILNNVPAEARNEIGAYLADKRRLTLALDDRVSADASGDAGSDFMLSGVKGGQLSGGAGADMLVGRTGADLLEGGSGDDILVGGAGNDFYTWRTGDGQDRIIDSDKRGTILINGTPVAGSLIRKGDAEQWATADGKVTLSHAETWKLALSGGGSIDLGANFTSGDYGIHLNAALTSPQIGRTILGDLTPIDADPGKPGIQHDHDDIGNVKVDPNQPEPDRADDLKDSPGNDRVKAGDRNVCRAANDMQWRKAA